MTYIFFTIVTLLIILSYCYLILKKLQNPLLNLYLITNIFIFYLPAILYSLFGLTHPSISYSEYSFYDYKPIFLSGLSLVFLFDLVLISSYWIISKNLKMNYSQLSIINKTNLSNNFTAFFLVMGISVICFDILNILINK